MRFFRLLLPFLCGLLSLAAACSAPAAGVAATPTLKRYPALGQPQVSIPGTEAETALPSAGLAPESLRQAQYTTYAVNEGRRSYRLQDGKYQQGTEPASPDYVSAFLLETQAFGDLDGDGAGDAVVLLGENYGGSGTFVSMVVMLNREGEPVQAAVVPLDDRPLVNSLFIEDGQVGLDAILHAANAPRCCANFPVTRTYILEESGLILTRQASRTPDGAERAITITSPSAGAQVSGAVQVWGSVSIAPFENNLVYRLFDARNQFMGEGLLPVSAAQPGEAGTFEASIPLTAGSPGLHFRLEVVDVSMADGSTLALDSVQLVMK